MAQLPALAGPMSGPVKPLPVGGPPKQPSVEFILAQQANDAMQQGADPHAATEMLGTMLRHLRANPTVAQQATDAIAQGADPHAVSSKIWELANGGGQPPRESLHDELNGVAGAIARGMSFGQSGRLLAGATALKNIVTGHPANYGATLAEANKEHNDFASAHPVGNAAAEIGGGILSGVGAGKVLGTAAEAAPAVKASILRRTLAAAGTGSDAGAISGLINSSGSIDDHLRGAMAGSGAGAVFGAAAPAVGELAAGTGKAIVRGGARALRALSESPSFAGRADAAAADAAQTAPAILSAPSPAASGRATSVLAKRVLQSPVSIAQARQTALSAGDKPLTPMELFGTPVQRLGRYVTSIPSAGGAQLTKALDERGAGAANRVLGDAESAFGANRTNLLDKADELIAARRAAANPLYEKAYAAPPIDDPSVLETLKLPAFQAAYKRGARIAATEGEALPPLTRMVTVNGKQTTEMVPQPLKSIDYIKRGLDDVIDSKMRGGSMGKTEARALRNRLQTMLETVDAQVPDYAAARNQFAGDSRLMDALERGRSFLDAKGEPLDALTRDYPKLSEGEKELYHVGAVGAIRDKLMNTPDQRDLSKALIGTPNLRERMRVLLGDSPELDRFMQSVGQEGQMVKSRNTALVGSPTFDKEADNADVNGAVAGTLGSFLTGGTKEAARRVGERLLHSSLLARANGVNAETADALAPKLTATGGALQSLLDEIANDVARLGKQRARQPLISAGAGAAGGQVGGPYVRRLFDQ